MRFLLADEVGLGKTIEAGLILDPLLSSDRVKRVLVLTPAIGALLLAPAVPARAAKPASAPAADPPEPAAARQTGATASAPDAAPAPRERASVALSARPPNRPPPLSPRRKLIAGILGGVGIATLITAFALNVTDGRPTTMDCDAGAALTKVCVLDNKVAYTLGYAATSALAVSIGMTLFWPERQRPSSTEVK